MIICTRCQGTTFNKRGKEHRSGKTLQRLQCMQCGKYTTGGPYAKAQQ